MKELARYFVIFVIWLPSAAANAQSVRFGPWNDTRANRDAGSRSYYSQLAKSEVSYQIFLPHDYDTDSQRRYPVLYWLHGRGGGQRQTADIAKRFETAARSGKVPAMIIVGVNGRKTSGYTDSKDGTSPVQSVIVKELIPHIDTTFRTISSREGRAVEGFSMGGTGAAKLGTTYPDVFGAFSALAGGLDTAASFQRRGSSFQDIYGSDEKYYEEQRPSTNVVRNADKLRGRTRIRIVVGEKDRNLNRNRRFHQLLLDHKIAHSFTVVPEAGHSPGALYNATEELMWAFYRTAFGTAKSEQHEENTRLPGGALAGERPRIMVSTDIGGSDPDDYQSLIHLLLYADVLDIEGLIASPPHTGRLKHIQEVLDAYKADYEMLTKNSGRRFPSPDHLKRISVQGATDAASEKGWSSPTDGSRLILRQAQLKDKRPLWILVWGSLTDVAQAVHDDPSIVANLRVYSIGSWNTQQDQFARDYLFKNHTGLWWIECDTTFRGMYMGGEQDADFGNLEFVRQHVRGHGALGDLFWNKKRDIKMGDTPSVLYLLKGTAESPTEPHWGGAFRQTKHGPHYWTDATEKEVMERNRPGAKTVNKWREEFLTDWKARMDWVR